MARLGTCTFILGALLFGNACSEDESSPEPGGPPTGGAPSAADWSVESDGFVESDGYVESDGFVQERFCGDDWCREIVQDVLNANYTQCEEDPATFEAQLVQLQDVACEDPRVGCAECSGLIGNWDCATSQAIVDSLQNREPNACLGF